MVITWLPIALVVTAVAFVVGFKKNASYDRMWEARKCWGAILNNSRSWGIMVNDFIINKRNKEYISYSILNEHKIKLIKNHFAWLTVFRFQIREPRNWEAIYKQHNQEYKDKWFSVQEQNGNIETEIAKYLTIED